MLQRSSSRSLPTPVSSAVDREPAHLSAQLPTLLANSQPATPVRSASPVPAFAGLSQKLLNEQTEADKLPAAVRSHREAALGQDFSDVQVRESQTAAPLGAQAFTTGDHITFAPGQLDMSSRKGREPANNTPSPESRSKRC